MSKPEPKKRKLKFENLDGMLEDAQNLLERGYVHHGNWNLAQSTSHVAKWMTYPLDGFPIPPIWLRPIFWLMKITVGPGMKKKILAEGFSAGTPTAPESVPDSGSLSDAQGVEELRQAVERIKNHTGELLPSPLFGPMDKETLVTVSMLHGEHHFGYLEPK